ncbi:MAG: hypoxanthine phosphoribosyltransferase [Clostridiales bacterium]|nr:hypoxanthine phosphoribosyltransferase [Candidatus Apopatocola equi]MCQ2439797.1 hypoxanthine phosphoribosyltransferase [Oscillospiraceae bacterium]
MTEDFETILYTEEQLRARVDELGRELSRDFAGKNPVFLGVLKGCFVFMADLIRRFDGPCTLDFMAVSSYGGGTTSTGAVKITKDLSSSIHGRHVIIVEDILDTGITLSYLRKYLMNQEPASLTICTMFDKPERRTVPIEAEYSGFTIPNAFVVGYGLDYDERYRNYPGLAILKPEVYSK